MSAEEHPSAEPASVRERGIRRRPTWVNLRRGYYRGAALSEIHSAAGWILTLFAVGAFVLIATAIEQLPEPQAFALLAGGGAAAAVAWGLWRGHLWAGRVAGILAAALALIGVVSLFLDTAAPTSERLYRAVMIGVWCGGAAFLLRPSARGVFRQAQTGRPAGSDE